MVLRWTGRKVTRAQAHLAGRTSRCAGTRGRGPGCLGTGPGVPLPPLERGLASALGLPAAQEVRPQGFCGSLSQCAWISVGKRSRAPRPCSSPRLSVCGRQEGRCARTQSQPCHSPAVWQVTDFLEASSWVTSHGGGESDRSRAGCTLSLRLSRARGGPAWTTGGRPPGLRAPVLSNALCRLPS